MYIDAPGNRPPNFTVPKGNVTTDNMSAACVDCGIDKTYSSIEEPTGPYGNSGNS